MKTITEYCSNCETEVTMEWDVEMYGYKAYCPFCGKRLMLCDMCQHPNGEEQATGDCDYDSRTDTCKFNRMVDVNESSDECASLMPLKCLRCGDTYEMSMSAMIEAGYTKYSYCNRCVDEAISLLKEADKQKEENQPFWVLTNTLGNPLKLYGKIMAYREKDVAERERIQTEAFMQSIGKKGWGIKGILIREHKLSDCTFKQDDLIFMEKTADEYRKEKSGNENA